jgi:protein SCO1/2
MKFFGAAFALFVLASVGVHNEAHGAVTNLSNADPNASTKIDEKQALAISQAAIGRKIGDYVFRDTHGKRVKLSDFQGQPLVISMIYTSCHDVCPIITSTIQSVDSIARDALGDDSFKIITIGFDSSSDSPTRMQSFARKNGIRLSDHWRFLSGDLESVSRLSNDIGFQFFESPKGFDHLTQTTIVDAKGRVFQQIYGETFQTPNFVDPLKNLVFGTSVPFASLGDLINKVRLFCTIYDPASDQYHFKYSMFFRMFVGASVILSMMTFIGKWLWQNRRSAKKPPPHFKTQP